MSNADGPGPSTPPPLDTTPDYPPADPEQVRAATVALSRVLRNMPRQPHPGAADPNHGQRLARADELVNALAGDGHELGAAAWAVHQCVRDGRLIAEVRNDEEEVGAREGIDPSDIFERSRPLWGSHGRPRTVRIPGQWVTRPTYTGRGPVPFDCLLVRTTPAFWEVPSEPAPDTTAEFIRSLLAGPDDVELTPREMALLGAYLSAEGIDLEKLYREAEEERATGHSQSRAVRRKLNLIRNFNRRLQRLPTQADENDDRQTESSPATSTD